MHIDEEHVSYYSFKNKRLKLSMLLLMYIQTGVPWKLINLTFFFFFCFANLMPTFYLSCFAFGVLKLTDFAFYRYLVFFKCFLLDLPCHEKILNTKLILNIITEVCPLNDHSPKNLHNYYLCERTARSRLISRGKYWAMVEKTELDSAGDVPPLSPASCTWDGSSEDPNSDLEW